MYMTPEELRALIQRHQDATDTTDSEALMMLCEIFAECVKVGHSWMSDKIVEKLERLPGDCG